MATQLKQAGSAPQLRADNYLSRDFAKAENEHLWSKVWLVAGREEELRNVGDFLTFNVATESIVVARGKDGLVAYHNVCPHRGRRLADGCGRASQFRCKYHGWTFNLEGKNVQVLDRHDWEGSLDDERIDLWPVRVDTWAGFIWICMDEDAETLAEYLETIPEHLDPFEIEEMRFRWKVELHLPVNWKVALEAFMEGYHVAATHPQLIKVAGNDYTQSFAHGKHAHFGYWKDVQPLGTSSPRLAGNVYADAREGVVEFFRQIEEDLNAIQTDRDFEAAKKIMDILPEGTDAMTAMITAIELGRQAAIDDGAAYPEKLTFEAMAKAGSDWHIFPNCVTLPYFDGALWYRARPDTADPDNPEKCLFEIWSLKRYAPGKEPKIETRVIMDPTKESVGLILDQDIANMTEVQAGMKSSKFKYARPNPVQEMEVINFHRTLEQYVLGQARG
ncbi:aromatic ring-hydroxylating oxygenase subunit alpha [Sphingopyxis flava]|uniref:Rieske [2Fe-2S] domain-containing protein n=1 Tax=Sphingopyxis flava TaxID=1507287 RepID=A0A1T5E608_9SPHN|nr:SRPBCC family protein [Sphingopyxis flava]SKB79256.1 Rieske [2Fe-2S] domain-containing protein [Sphingopyxis flava]